jgi:hypothetical protein
MVNAKHRKRGPKPISDEIWNQVCDLYDDDKSVKEAMAATGLGQTKVYEIYRNPVRRERNATPQDAA